MVGVKKKLSELTPMKRGERKQDWAWSDLDSNTFHTKALTNPVGSYIVNYCPIKVFCIVALEQPTLLPCSETSVVFPGKEMTSLLTAGEPVIQENGMWTAHFHVYPLFYTIIFWNLFQGRVTLCPKVGVMFKISSLSCIPIFLLPDSTINYCSVRIRASYQCLVHSKNSA